MSDMRVLVTDDYLDKDYFLNADNEAEAAEKADRKIKFIKVLFCLLCVLLIGELVVYKYIMPSFSSPKVTVTGQNNYSAEEIEVLAVYFIFYSSTWIRLDGDIEQLENYCSSAIQNKSTDKLIIWVQQELKYNLLHLYSQNLENYRNGKISTLITEIQQFITKHKDNLIIETIEE